LFSFLFSLLSFPFPSFLIIIYSFIVILTVTCLFLANITGCRERERWSLQACPQPQDLEQAASCC
jgi:hypothetical protein